MTTDKFIPSNPDTWGLLLTLEQTAKILGVSVWTLRKWDDNKKFIAVRVGSRNDRRYKKQDVIAYLNSIGIKLEK